MKKTMLIAGAAMIAVTIPAIAAHHEGSGDGHKMMMQDMTRADVEAKVKDHFAKVDGNKDGAVTQDEMKAFREARRAKMQDAHFKKMDANGDGSISRDEFDTAHAARHDKMAKGDGEGHRKWKEGRRGHHGMMATKMGGHIFKKADANNDGKVTLAEAEIAALAHFDKVDADKNGTVTAAERMDYWKAKKDEWRAKKAEKPS